METKERITRAGASREVKETEDVGIKEAKWEPLELIYYLPKGEMMNVRERVAYGEKFTETEMDWVRSKRQKLLEIMQ